MTPRYTVENCLGSVSTTAIRKLMPLTPERENNTVVTVIAKVSKNTDIIVKTFLQCAGRELSRAMIIIKNPPSRTTRASSPYERLFFSHFSARPRQQWTNVLRKMYQPSLQGRSWNLGLLKFEELAKNSPSGDDTKAWPEAPDDAAYDCYDFVPE